MAEEGDPSGTKPPQQPLWVEKGLLTEQEQLAYDILERGFNEVLSELQSEPALDRFRIEYEKLHRALKKSHESEKRLIRKCRELNTEILTNNVKIKTALGNNEEDQLLILHMREETHKAWKMVDASQEKEAEDKEKIRFLKQEIENLSGIVDQGAEQSFSKDAEVTVLEEEKQNALKERDQIMSEVADLKAELAKWTEKVTVLEKDKLKFVEELADVKTRLLAKKVECDRELRKKERLEKDMRDLRISIEDSQMVLKQKEETLNKSQDYVSKLEMALQEQKSAADKSTKMMDALHVQVNKLQNDLEDQIKTNTQLLAENSSKLLDLKATEEELDAAREELIKVKKVREATIMKLKLTEQQKEELEEEKVRLQNEILQLEKEAEIQRKLTENEKKRLEEFSRERDVLTKMKTEAEELTIKHVDTIRIKETVIYNLETEVQQFKAQFVKQDKQILQLEREHQKVGEEASDSAKKYLKTLDELQEKEFRILELQKKIEGSQMQIKQQKAMYESVRVEKNNYSKRLVQTQDEIREAKRKLAISTQMIEHLKDQLSLADIQLEKGVEDITRVGKEKEVLNAQLSSLQDQIKEAEDRISGHTARIETHDFLMTQMEAEQERIKSEFTVIKSERDLMAAQLIRRTDELQLVYEKIRVQQATLDKGRNQYMERLNELRVLKLKLTDFKREHIILSAAINQSDVLKKEIHNVARDLTREQLKVKALTEELETPQNIHRWRAIEATDPPTYEMIVKIQTLQKRLIQKTEEVLDKDIMIQQKEKLYIEMQALLARRPNPEEAAEQLETYSKKLAEKTRQLKAMSSELRLYQARVEEHRAEIRSLNNELVNAKRTYLDQKEKESLDKQRRKNLSAPSSNQGGLRPPSRMRPTTTHSSMRPVNSALMVGR
ncbi:unnamed protein product [Calypogeia fissa]